MYLLYVDMKRFRIRIEYGEIGKQSLQLLSVQVRRVLVHINIDLDCIITVLSENCCMISMYQ